MYSDPFGVSPFSGMHHRCCYPVNSFRKFDEDFERLLLTDTDARMQYNERGDLSLKCQTAGFR